MLLADELAAEVGGACKVCRWRASLSAADQQALDHALSTMKNAAVVRVMRRHGSPITEASVRRHKARHA